MVNEQALSGQTRAAIVKNGEERETRHLWLVRHGLTAWNTQLRFCGHSDVPLSPQGRVQARWLARRLQEEAITAIYTSDLARAQETAEIIASPYPQPIPVQVSAAWREINFGAWEGLTYPEIAERFKGQLGFFSDPERCPPPGGECLAQMLQRVWVELMRLMGNGDWSVGGDIVIVSHAGPLRVLLCRLLGIALERQWQLRIDPGSLSALDLLPIQEPSAPQGILTLLNAQRSAPRSSTSIKRTRREAENGQEEGTN